MQWDLGPQGVGLLVVMSLAFGVIAHLMMGRTMGRWVWLVAAASYFVLGIVVSEVFFGWATEEELQPNVDGLSFDEVLLAAFPAVVVVLVLRHLSRKRAAADLR
jgi:hypothetical protein